jgi:hypothetical protein
MIYDLNENALYLDGILQCNDASDRDPLQQFKLIKINP